MAIATNEEPLMTGRHKELTSRVENDYDHLLTVRDFCHIYNLICQKAFGVKGKRKKFILVEINDSKGEYQEKKVRVIHKQSEF